MMVVDMICVVTSQRKSSEVCFNCDKDSYARDLSVHGTLQVTSEMFARQVESSGEN